MEIAKQELQFYFPNYIVNIITNYNSPYQSIRYQLAQYFPDVLVSKIQQLLIPDEIFNPRNLFHDIILFQNFKRHVRKKGYQVKYFYKKFNQRKQIDPSYNFDFEKDFCLKCNKSMRKCKCPLKFDLPIKANNYNILRIMGGFDGLSFRY